MFPPSRVGGNLVKYPAPVAPWRPVPKGIWEFTLEYLRLVEDFSQVNGV